MDNPLFVAAVLVVAGVLALEFGISSAITEIVAALARSLAVSTPALAWLEFLAQFGLLGLMVMILLRDPPSELSR